MPLQRGSLLVFDGCLALGRRQHGWTALLLHRRGSRTYSRGRRGCALFVPRGPIELDLKDEADGDDSKDQDGFQSYDFDDDRY